MPNAAITLVHLSDIHFSRRSGSTYDLDRNLRSQLENDLRELKEEVGNYTGIVITGDIAFSASDEEYAKALEWISELCDLTGIPINYVWIVPGNHDINREALRENMFLDLLHEDLRERTSDDNIDQWFKKTAGNEKAAEQINSPLANFNRFAVRFMCDTDLAKPFWTADLPLDDGSKLTLVGLNSVFASNQKDSKDANKTKMVLPTSACLQPVRPGTTYMSLCHHPPSWLRNEKSISNALNGRIKLQLFGHEHDQQVSTTDGCLRIFAGAVHPERDESRIEAHYNVLSLNVVLDHQNNRQLKTRIYPRQYNSKTHRFERGRDCDAGNYRDFFLPLPAFVREISPVRPTSAVGAAAPQETAMQEIQYQQGIKLLLIKFSKLRYPKQLEIMESLGLFEAADEHLPAPKRMKTFLARAQERDLLFDLWEYLTKAEGINEPNPFRQSKTEYKTEKS